MTASQDMIRGRSNIITLTNNSGGGLVAGDVCVQDTTADEKATTTTSAASTLKVFIAAETIANGAAGKFYESGYCPLVNVNASVTRGRFLFTHTVAKQAAENATYGAGAFGKLLKSGTTPSAIIYSATAQTSGGGAGSDTTAIHNNVASEISGITEKTSLTGNDLFLIEDSADSNNKKRVKQSNLGGGAPTTTPYVTTASDAGLSAEVVIPGLAGSPDKAPIGANDDEFNTTNGSGVTGWTSFGTPDTIDENTFVLSHVHLKSNAAANDNHKGIYKAHGAGTAFTVVTKITAGAVTGVGPRFGLYLSHGAPGKFAGIAGEIDSSSAFNVYASMIWTNPTTFGSNPTGVSMALGSSNIEVTTGAPTKPLWLKLVVTDSAHVQSYMSHNGYFWIAIGASWDTSLGAGNTDYVVLAVDSNSASIPCEMIFDYVRFS